MIALVLLMLYILGAVFTLRTCSHTLRDTQQYNEEETALVAVVLAVLWLPALIVAGLCFAVSPSIDR